MKVLQIQLQRPDRAAEQQPCVHGDHHTTRTPPCCGRVRWCAAPDGRPALLASRRLPSADFHLVSSETEQTSSLHSEVKMVFTGASQLSASSFMRQIHQLGQTSDFKKSDFVFRYRNRTLCHQPQDSFSFSPSSWPGGRCWTPEPWLSWPERK